MRTNIVLDDELVAEAMKLTGASTKREVVNLALAELVRRHRQRDMLDLPNEALIDPGYDVRAVRRSMNRGTG